jgi:hypothetical protein
MPSARFSMSSGLKMAIIEGVAAGRAVPAAFLKLMSDLCDPTFGQQQ